MAIPPRVQLVFGAGGIGEGTITHAWTTGEQTSELLDVLKELEITELDSAASSPPGSPRVSERLLGESRAVGKGFVIDTKIERTAISGGLSEDAIDSSLKKSLELLGAKQCNILYAHFPDPNTPVEESARAFDKHYRAGLFRELGLCNHSYEQVREWLQVCKRHNYVKPTVWQGHYNAIRRAPETELFPFLKEHNIRIHAYSPLAGGFLTGKVSLATEAGTLSGGRWEPGRFPFYVKAFDKPAIHTAMIAFCKKCDAAGVTPTEVSLRWIVHHSALGEGDAIILGASRLDQLRSNVEFCNKGRLDKRLLEAYEELWKGVEKDPPEWF